jgi:histidyl-tRNA synthetase
MSAQKVATPAGIRPLIYFIPIGEEAKQRCFTLTAVCRHNNIAADVDLQSKKVPAAIQNACRAEAKYVCIIGSDELHSGTVTLKELATRETKTVEIENIIKSLSEL